MLEEIKAVRRELEGKLGPGSDPAAAERAIQQWSAAAPGAWQPHCERMLLAQHRKDRPAMLAHLRAAYAHVGDATVRGRMEQNFRELGEPVPERR